ncbi:MAG TPA: hypothetical protein VFH44_00545 [Solirubrobacterales bacterium]|nr:hypothetical protein [Solirubrobacterales bacterium]
MTRPHPIRPAPLALALLVLALALPGTAAAGTAVLDAPGSAGAVRDYWTKQRMRQAEPVPVPPPRRTLAGPAEASGAPTSVPPAGPEASSAAPLRRGAAQGGVAAAGRVAVLVADPAAAGVRAHGKVFFKVRKGSAPGDYVCSGTAVNSRNQSLVWTAGHCVFDVRDNGGRSVNLAFVPAYDAGASPYGVWTAKKLATVKRWRRDGDLRYDLGAAVVRRRRGQTLQSVVGARGIGFDQPRRQDYSIFGYPALEPFDGEHEYRCDSPKAGSDLSGGRGPRTIGARCDMTPGASGGGWIAGGTLLSVTSYSYGKHPKSLYGPYLSRKAKKLYKRMRGRAGRS